MLDLLIAPFASASGVLWIALINDASIALACFVISITMAVLLRQRRNDTPHPWLGTLLVVFIVACGLTHLVEAVTATVIIEDVPVQAALNLFCTVISVTTAIAFAFILPRIKLLPSPAQQREALEKLVSQRTGEKDQLIREINHRIGNQLQIISSMLNVESRKTANEEALDIFRRMKTELGKMAHEHIERSKVDYLRYGVSAPDGTVTAAKGGEIKPGVLSA
jgi:hypothetical protein